jgi:small-conductance mechanosensitive channel
MEQFFNTIIIDNTNFQIVLWQIIVSLLILVIYIVLISFGKRIFRRIIDGTIIQAKSIKASKRFYYVFLSFFMVFGVFKSLGIQTKSVLGATIVQTDKVDIILYHFIVLFFVLSGTRFLVAIVETIINRYEKKMDVEQGKSRSLFMIIKYFVYVLTITFFVQAIGFSITFIIASVSALLVGVGLGIQHFFNDIISGIVILFDHSIKVGDVVEIEGDIIGEVSETRLRTSKLITRDDVIMIVPNSLFTSEKVINWSHNTRKSRFEVKVGVAYGSDVRKVEQLLIQAATSHPHIEKDPPPKVFFEDFGSSSLDFSVKFYSQKQFRIEPIRSELRFEIDCLFRENNIVIPFPQQDVYIKQMPKQ